MGVNFIFESRKLANIRCVQGAMIFTTIDTQLSKKQNLNGISRNAVPCLFRGFLDHDIILKFGNIQSNILYSSLRTNGKKYLQSKLVSSIVIQKFIEANNVLITQQLMQALRLVYFDKFKKFKKNHFNPIIKVNMEKERQWNYRITIFIQ